MQNLETRLFVFWDDNSSFTDLSNQAQNYARDPFSVELSATEDYLYIGYTKPINAVYIGMDIPVTTANTFVFQYYFDDGVTPAWTTLTSTQFNDETKGLTRSGFLSWERNLTDEAEVTINSQEAFWYRLRPSANHDTGTQIKGINILFADDEDLRTVVPSILSRDKFIADGEVDHILSHVAARDAIVQRLRNDGRFKVNLSTGEFKDFNSFDLLQISQLREAGKWKALSIIFGDLSDNAEDFYAIRSAKYEKNFETSFRTAFLNIDLDDDGIEDTFEELSSNTPTILRR